MSYTVKFKGDSLKGTIDLTTSKSISNRLLIMQALSSYKFNIEKLSISNDTEVMLNGLSTDSDIVDIGPAGTTMRFLTALFATKGLEKTLTGSERMQQRPIGKLVDALKQLGCNVSYVNKEGYPPLKFGKSTITTNVVTIDGSTSSQFITAMLLVAPTLPQGLHLKIAGKLVSAAYVNLTLKLMEYMGISYVWENNEVIIEPQEYVGKDIRVEADWSGASYWYQMAAYAKTVDLTITGLNKDSLQGDSITAKLFEHFGVKTEFLANGLKLSKGTVNNSLFEYDFDLCPDLVQTIVPTACFLGVPFKLTGAETLRIKETDRILALQQELIKFGFDLLETADGVMEWDGKKGLEQAAISIETYEDHRMAMAFAPIAMVTSNIVIEEPNVVVKSYPKYWEDLKAVGFSF